jgi:hypothetical protein
MTPDPTSEPEVKVWTVSPSQYSTWSTCKRRWYFEKVLGLMSPQHPAAELGERCHLALEHYIATGERTGDEDVLRILTCIWDQPWLVERIKNPTSQVEQWATGKIGGVPYRGRIDLNWKDGRKAYIVDHKSTSNFKYRKTYAEALIDPQTLIYADFLFQDPDIDEIEITYHYFQTKGIPQNASLVTVTHTRDSIEKPLYDLSIFLEEMREMRTFELRDVPKNTDACWSYGRRCPFASECEETPEAGQETIPQEPIMDFGKLIAQRRAQTAAAQNETPPPASPADKIIDALSSQVDQVMENVTPPTRTIHHPTSHERGAAGLPLVLFGCLIPGVEMVELEDLATPYIERWQKQNKDIHYLNSEYFKAERSIAVSLVSDMARGILPIPQYLYVRTDSPMGKYFSAEMRLLKGKVRAVIPAGI